MPGSSPDPAPYRDKNRRLLQNYEAAFEDRDLLTTALFEDTSAGDAARRRSGVEDETFAVLPVGKDGGEKFRSADPIRPQDLLDRIDAMPVRRREAREKGRT